MAVRGYDLVADGGTNATRTSFDVRNLTPPFRLPPRSLLLFPHRSDWDIPLTMNIFWPGRMWRDHQLVFVARDDMFVATDTDDVPWLVANSEDKRRVRLNIISDLLSRIPYKPVPRTKVVLPKRQKPGNYREPDHPVRRIADKY